MNEIETQSGLAATPGYRYAKRSGNQLHIAGQVPLDASGSVVHPEDAFAQAEQCLTNLRTLINCHEFAEEDIQHITIYVVGPHTNLTSAWQAILQGFSNEVPPATLLGVSVLGYENQLVEIDATIVKQDH